MIKKRLALVLAAVALTAATMTPGAAGAADDTTSPSVALGMPGLRMYQTDLTFAVRWAGLDESGIAGYDVQRRIFRWNGDDTGWRDWLTGTTSTSRNYSGNYGRTFCFRVRAHDTVGNTSIYTVPGCVSIPLHSGHLIYGGGWFRGLHADAYAGRFAWTTRQGAATFRTDVRGEQLALVVTKCPTCGSVRVLWNGVPVKSVSLASSTVQRSVIVPVAEWGWARSGSVSIQVRSASPRIVPLEGLAVYRD